MKLLALFLTLFTVKAQASINCTEYLRRQGVFQIQRAETDRNFCFLGVDPFNVPDNFVYRSYLFTDEGLLMVFNSFGVSEGSHGARVFYFFPRKLDPDMAVRNRGQLTIQTATPGVELILSTDKTQILGMKGGKVKEASSVSPSNLGGVEFSNVQTLMLDAGFTMRKDPTSDPDRTSRFIDSKNHVCEVRNSQIFDYTSDGDSNLKFSDSELKSFLKVRCPNISAGF